MRRPPPLYPQIHLQLKPVAESVTRFYADVADRLQSLS
jgi:hypothetical protein